MIPCNHCGNAKKVLTYYPSMPVATATSKKGEPAVLCKKCRKELRAFRFQETPELTLASIQSEITFTDGTFLFHANTPNA